MSAHIVPLAATHRRDDFDCGEEALNDFLRRYARQQGRDFSRTYVVLADDDVTVTAFVSVISSATELDISSPARQHSVSTSGDRQPKIPE